MNSANRFVFLDGLRAILVFVVVLEHLIKFAAPHALSEEVIFPVTLSGLSAIHLPPFNLLHNGAWAVATFFVLSGYIITYVLLNQKHVADGVIFLANRYIKFALMVLVSYLIIYVVFSLEGQAHNLTLVGVLSLSLYETLFNYNYSYNPVLWTLGFEIYGAVLLVFLVFIYKLLLARKFPMTVAAILFLSLLFLLLTSKDVLYGHIMALFLLGALLTHVKFRFEKTYLKVVVHTILLIGAFLLISVDVRGGLGNSLLILNLSPNEYIYKYFINGLGAFLLLLSVLNSGRLQRILNSDVLVVVGSMSFSIYITHYIVISTVFTMTIFKGYSVGLLTAVSLVVSGVVSIIVHWLVEDKFYGRLKIPFIGTNKEKGDLVMVDNGVTYENKS